MPNATLMIFAVVILAIPIAALNPLPGRRHEAGSL
jgi:hypothetical protein